MSDANETTEQHPFLVHMEGPDDIEEFATWDEACTAAHEFNVGVLAYNERTQSQGRVRSWAIPYLRTDFEERWAKIMAPEPAASNHIDNEACEKAVSRDRGDLWGSLDWMLWGIGMGDTFREPLADKMISALSDEEFTQAEAAIRGWNERRGGPVERNLFTEMKAERDAALAVIERAKKRIGTTAFGGDTHGPTTYLVRSVYDILATAPADALAEHDRVIAEKAWDAGWVTGYDAGMDRFATAAEYDAVAREANPYRGIPGPTDSTREGDSG